MQLPNEPSGENPRRNDGGGIDRRSLLKLVGGLGIGIGGAAGTYRYFTQCDDAIYETDTDGPSIAPPLRGEWKIWNPPGHPCLALDFTGMQSGSRLPYPPWVTPSHLFWTVGASAFYGWEHPIYSPFSGEVIKAIDGAADTTSLNLFLDIIDTVVSSPASTTDDIRAFAGNYVVIQSEESDDVVAFFAHLRQGSVAVDEGEAVTAGEQLGTVGNSGLSAVPHLHFQLMSEWTTDLERAQGTLLPIQVGQCKKRVNGRWDHFKNCKPKPGDRIRFS